MGGKRYRVNLGEGTTFGRGFVSFIKKTCPGNRWSAGEILVRTKCVTDVSVTAWALYWEDAQYGGIRMRAQIISQDRRSNPPPGGYTTHVTLRKLDGEGLCRAQRSLRASSVWPELMLLRAEGEVAEVAQSDRARMFDCLATLVDRRIFNSLNLRSECDCYDAREMVEAGMCCKHTAALCYLLIERGESAPGKFLVEDLGVDLNALLDEDIENQKIAEASQLRTYVNSNTLPRMWSEARVKAEGTAEDPVIL